MARVHVYMVFFFYLTVRATIVGEIILPYCPILRYQMRSLLLVVDDQGQIQIFAIGPPVKYAIKTEIIAH